jgi:capsular polysaccharide biosynthesis protein
VNSPEILKRLVRRFGLLAVLTLLGAIAGGIYSALATPTYQAQAYVVASAEAGEGPAALNFAQAYGRIATKGPVADKAATKLGSTKGLDQVTASTSPDTPVIEITATGTDAKQTAAVANAVAQSLVEFGATRKTETRVTLTILAAANVPASPSSPRPPMEAAIGGAGGLLIGGLAVLAGVGRAKKNEPALVDERYQVAQIVQPPAVAQPTMQALTVSYNADGQPSFEAQPNFDQQSSTDQKIVGRAVVIYQQQEPR